MGRLVVKITDIKKPLQEQRFNQFIWRWDSPPNITIFRSGYKHKIYSKTHVLQLILDFMYFVVLSRFGIY